MAGPIYATMPNAYVGVPYSFTVQQADIAIAFANTPFIQPGASLPPFTFTALGPPYGFVWMLVDFNTGLPIPGLTVDSTGNVTGTPTTQNLNVAPLVRIRSADNPTPPPTYYTDQFLIVNGFSIIGASNRSYPLP